MTSSHDLSPRAAAAELNRASLRARRRAHWPAWMFLVLAAVNFFFFVVVGSVDHTVSQALIPVPTLLAVAIFVFVSRQPVIGHDAQKINKPVALAAIAAAVVGLIVDQVVLPHRFSWWLVVLAALMVTPYLVGAWRWLRR